MAFALPVAADDDMNTGGDAGGTSQTAALITSRSGTAYLGGSDDADDYKIYVSSGQVINISMTFEYAGTARDFLLHLFIPDPSLGADSYSDIIYPSETIPGASTLGGGTQTINRAAPVSGYYLIHVLNRSSGTSSGNYSMTVTVTGGEATPTNQTTTTSTAAISAATATANISVSANVGQISSATENGITSILVSSDKDVVIYFAENLLVKSLVVSANAAMSSVSVQVEQTVQKPTAVSEPTAAVSGTILSHYLEITATPAAENSVTVENAIIDFKVLKSWITANKIDQATVKLLRYVDGQWVELTTQSTGADDTTYAYYRATSPGLSTFAVVGRAASSTPFGIDSNLLVIIVVVLVGISAIVAAAVKLRK